MLFCLELWPQIKFFTEIPLIGPQLLGGWGCVLVKGLSHKPAPAIWLRKPQETTYIMPPPMPWGKALLGRWGMGGWGAGATGSLEKELLQSCIRIATRCLFLKEFCNISPHQDYLN